MKTEDALKHFGGVRQVATALGISPAAVYQWGVRVPKSRAFELEVLTQGALKAPRASEAREAAA